MNKFFYRKNKTNSLILIIVYVAFLFISTLHLHKFNFTSSNIFVEQVLVQDSNSREHFLDNSGNCLIQQFSQSLINLDYIPHQFSSLELKEKINEQNYIVAFFLLTNTITPRAPPIV